MLQAIYMALKCTFRSRDANTIRLLYTTLVRPILDYVSTIWNPSLMSDILEKVQRRATKLISSLENLSYDQRLQQLNLPTLLYHRTWIDIIMTYKILHRVVSLDENDFLNQVRIGLSPAHLVSYHWSCADRRYACVCVPAPKAINN